MQLLERSAPSACALLARACAARALDAPWRMARAAWPAYGHVTILNRHFLGGAKLRLECNTAKHVKKEQRQVN